MAKDLEKLEIIITAGPTIEHIDPVRYITNHSSGKMGYALAEAATQRGAHVTLISGRVALDCPAGCDLIQVETALEMEAATLKAFEKADVAICTAAVCDFRPKEQFDRKLKKLIDGESLQNIELVPNPDILRELCEVKREDQIVIGFAAETNDLKLNAAEKLTLKNADYIIANDISEGKVFGSDYNTVSIMSLKGTKEYPQMLKRDLADIILDLIVK